MNKKSLVLITFLFNNSLIPLLLKILHPGDLYLCPTQLIDVQSIQLIDSTPQLHQDLRLILVLYFTVYMSKEGYCVSILISRVDILGNFKYRWNSNKACNQK